MVLDESPLLDRALGGDAEAFGQLVRAYQDRLFTSIVHVVGSTEDAEDVLQDAFVQAFTKLASFRRGSRFYTWLYRIAFNVAVNRRRRRRPEVSIEQAVTDGPTQPLDPGGHPDAELVRREQALQIQAALARLSEEFRAVLVLREMEGFDYEAIAEILSISMGTVRSRLHRARAQMRGYLRHMQADRRL